MKSWWISLGLLIVSATSGGAQEARSILFIGNSFTYGHGSAVRYWRPDTVTDLNREGVGGVPALFKAFTTQVGVPYDVYLETRGGSSIDFHLQEKRAEITRQPWDVVVAHGFSTLDPQNPGDPTALLRSGRNMAELLVARNPDVDFYVTATWSRPDLTYQDGSPWSGKSIDTMGIDVNAAYSRLAAEVDGVKGVNPVGLAFNRAMSAGVADPNPYDGIAVDQVDLYTFDHYHASSFGYYLEALVVFGNVTGVDPLVLGSSECSGFELGMSGAQAEALQQVAHDELVAAGVVLKKPAGLTMPARASSCATP